MIKSIIINTKGSKIPFATWERYKMVSRGTLGIIIIITASIISPRYRPWNTGASLKPFETPASKPKLSQT